MSDPKHGSVKPGWGIPKPDVIPKSTSWPVGMALAITLIAWGLLTSMVLFSVGLLLFVVSLNGWIGDIRNER